MVSVITSDAKLYMPMNELVDIEKELQRIAKEKAKAQKDVAMFEGKLSNESFVAKAPEAVVNAERAKLEKVRSLLAQLEELEQKLKR